MSGWQQREKTEGPSGGVGWDGRVCVGWLLCTSDASSCASFFLFFSEWKKGVERIYLSSCSFHRSETKRSDSGRLTGLAGWLGALEEGKRDWYHNMVGFELELEVCKPTETQRQDRH